MEYKHNLDADGQWDSICLSCYRTAASAKSEQELIPTETLHECDKNIRSIAERLRKRLFFDGNFTR